MSHEIKFCSGTSTRVRFAITGLGVKGFRKAAFPPFPPVFSISATEKGVPHPTAPHPHQHNYGSSVSETSACQFSQWLPIEEGPSNKNLAWDRYMSEKDAYPKFKPLHFWVYVLQPFSIEGWQNNAPQNVPLWHKDYLELKALEKQQV